MPRSGRSLVRGGIAVALVVLAARAEATVTQVDGTIVPVSTRMQGALDTYETPVGTLDAVKDAAEIPQIFKPRLSSAVVFKDIREGADGGATFTTPLRGSADSGDPAAVAAWTDFRTNQIRGDIYVAVAH